jgi:uncharacterized membrane protein YsdA (DUF1294 family)/cold shock CspA family protein
MRFQGKIRSWNTERGFGFIQPEQGGQDIFAHITSFKSRAARLSDGQLVSFEVETTQNGKKRAKHVELVRPAARRLVNQPKHKGQAQWGTATLLAIPAFALLYLLVAALWHPSPKVATTYAIFSVCTFGAYALDKSAARNGQYRLSERSLHIVALLGGWPGALIAQQVLRHKTTKPGFREVFWVTVVLNLLGFVVLCSPFGELLLRR